MEKINYISLEEALEIHKSTIIHSGGGDDGELDIGKLDSVLQHIQNDDYYPTFLDKLLHLFYCSCKFHCFIDGNKRIAITLTAMFLLKNGYMAIANVYFRERSCNLMNEESYTWNELGSIAFEVSPARGISESGFLVGCHESSMYLY